MHRGEVEGPCLSPWGRGEPPDLQSHAASVDLEVSLPPSLPPFPRPTPEQAAGSTPSHLQVQLDA